MSARRLLILDANALIHRAYHALPPLTGPNGEPVGALYGLCLTLLNVLKIFRPTHIAAAFDRPEKTFRHEQFEQYKAQRAKAPEELKAQIVKSREILEGFAIPVLDAKGYEADDVIGTLAARSAVEKLDTVIVTGDQDTLQLVNSHTRVHLLRRGVKDVVTFGVAEVRERFGLTPEQLIDFKALRGDPSDNIPGVPGVGEKTAASLLQQYHSLDNLYAHLDEIPGAVRKKLDAGKKAAYASRALVTIARTVPLKTSLDALARTPVDRSRLVRLFQEFGFASLLTRIPNETSAKAEPARTTQLILGLKPATEGKTHERRTPAYRLVTSPAGLSEIRAALAGAPGVVVDTETNRLGARTQPLHGISLAVKEGDAWYVPAPLVSNLKDLLEDPRLPKYGHNIKYDIEVLLQAGIHMQPVTFDSRLASYLLSPGTRAHDLDTLSFTVLGHEKIAIESLIGKGNEKYQRSLSELPLERIAEYSCEDADYTLRLVHHFEKELAKEPRLRLVFDDIEIPLIPVLAHMELAGVKLDTAVLMRLRQAVRRKLTAVEKKIYAAAGTTFNIASPQQLRDILFNTLRLPTAGIGRTQTGLSTASEELEKLRDAHPVVPLVQEHRELAKLVNTYLEALPKLVDADTGRVYTTYNQATTATGRLSSSDPNLQNIPIRTPLGAQIRTAFVAGRGSTLLSADYAQIQLRLAAHIAKDRAMQEAFRQGVDIHAETAAFAFGIPLAKVTPAQRRVAKTLNFGVLYGMGPQAFARAAEIPLGEAQRFIDQYMRTYRGIAEYMQEAKAAAATQGYVETISGRRRYLPEIASRNPQIRGEAERMAINHPIQGSEADMIKKAMIQVFREIDAGNPPFADVRMILQVHDELVFEVPKAAVEKVARRVKEIMEGVERLSVPVVVDTKAGPNWGKMKTLKV